MRLATIARGRRSRGAVHLRHPDRHRRDAARAHRGAAGAARPARALRPHPGNHHPEFPRQARHAHGAARPSPTLDEHLWTIAVARILFGADDEHPGAAQSRRRRAAATDRGRHQRLGRRVAGDARSRQPGAAVAARSTRSRAKPPRPARCWSSGSRSIPTTSQRAGALARSGAAHRACCAHATPRASRAPIDWIAGRRTTPPADAGAVAAARAASRCTPILDRAMRRRRARRSATSSRCSRRAATTFTRSAQRPTRCAQQVAATRVSYVVTRNINYTNICYFRCQFCAFSKGKLQREPARPALRSRPRRDPAPRARSLGARRDRSLPAGRHPSRLHRRRPISRSAAPSRTRCPDMHVHAFSPLEVWQGAATLGMPVARFPRRELKAAGLGIAARHGGRNPRRRGPRRHLPRQGHDRAMARGRSRPRIGVGLRTTATIMYGHVDRPAHWARHLLRIRDAAGADRRLHRIRAAAVRADGGADLSARAARAAARPCARRC